MNKIVYIAVFYFSIINIHGQIERDQNYVQAEKMIKGIIPSLEENDKEVKKINIDAFIEKPTRLKSGPSQYDSRIEMLQLDTIVDWEKKVVRNANGVGLIVEKEYIDRVSDQYYVLSLTTTLKNRFGVCSTEPFHDQYSLGVGTAFLIGEDTMVTAAHVFERPLHEYYVIFGYQLLNLKGKTEAIFSSNDVLQLARVITEHNLEDYDIAVFTTKEKSSYTPLTLSTTVYQNPNTQVYAVGHPLGIPKKVSLNARVIENKEEDYFFYSSLDAFQGNSGSPVFDFETNKVIGILVSGEIDFVKRGGCLQSRICGPPFCQGEKIVKIGILDWK